MHQRQKSGLDVTIYDVARLAGVSPASVSRVLNRVKVRPDVERRVQEAVSKLGFKRNMLASALTTKRTGTAGLVVPDVRNPFYAEVVRAIELAARLVGYSIVICNALEDAWRQIEYLELLRSRGADGLIALTHTGVDSYLIELASHGHPLVLMDRGSAVDERICIIGTDNKAGARMAMHHVLELGHREILVIAEAPHWPGSVERVQGCEEAAGEWGLDRPLMVVYSDTSTVAGGAAACRKALALHPEATAAVCGNDLLAVGAMLVARELGRSIPRQFSVVGFDGTSFAGAVEPALTTVVQPVAEMCQAAVELLIHQINGTMERPESRIMMPSLMLGQSTGPVPR